MKCTRNLSGFALAILFLPCTVASAVPLTVNFDPGGTPSIPQGPDTYAAAGPMQTIAVPNMVTITGGVVLGFPTNFPAIAFTTPPNLYATASIGDASLQNAITITIDPSFNVTQVGGVLANGLSVSKTYVVTAFSGLTPVDANVFLNMPSNFNAGFGVINLLNTPITSVTIAPAVLGGEWNFLVDTLTFNQPVPEPSSLALAALGIIAIVAARWRRKR